MLSQKDLSKLNLQEKRLIYFFVTSLTFFFLLGLIKDLYFKSVFLTILDSVYLALTLCALFIIRVKSRITPFNLIFVISLLFSIVLFLYLIYFRINLIILFFFPKLFVVGSFLNFKQDLKKMFFIFLFDFVLIVQYYIIDVKIISDILLDSEFRFYTILVYAVFFIVFLLLGIFIILKKKELLLNFHSIYQQTFEIVESDNDNIDIDRQNYLKSLIKNDYPIFYDQFKNHYPIFIDKIEKLGSNLVLEEMKIIALLYLNYSTKEIATISNSTLRAIEAKKYRIRKKMQIPSDKDLNMFLHNL